MHIVVCIKQVIDQEIPPQAFRINRMERRPDVPGAALVMSIFDANALEVALALREAAGAGSSITALSLGPPSAEEVLRKALAVTVDRAVLLTDRVFLHLDPPGVATAIASAVRRLAAEGAPPDLILTGRQAGDWEHGQTGGMVAEALGWPCLSCVSRLHLADGGLRARREVEDGYEIVLARGPLVATITNDDTNRLRLAKVRDVMTTGRKPIKAWSAVDLGLDAARLGPRVETRDLVIPETVSRCEFIEGKTPADTARILALRLRELKIV